MSKENSLSSNAQESQNIPHKTSFRELTQDELEDRVAGDIEMNQRTTFDETQTRPRQRAGTVLYGSENADFRNIMSNDWVYNLNKFLGAVYAALAKSFKFYFKFLLLLVVLLVAGGQAKSSVVILGLNTTEWFDFIIHIMIIHAVSTVFEILLFIFVELMFSSNYDFVYTVRSLEGPLAFLSTFTIFVNFFDFVKLPDLSIGYEGLGTVFILILICYTWKSYHVRLYYLRLLKTRLAPKLETLAVKKSILSIIASTTKLGGSNPQPWGLIRQASRSESVDTDMVVPSNVFRNINQTFREIVNETENKFPKEAAEDEEEEDAKVSSFWRNLSSRHRTLLLQGSMSVTTVSGDVIIRDKATAILFGKQLFNYISKNGSTVVSTETIAEAIRSSQNIQSSNAESILTTALNLFRHSEESSKILITEADMISGVNNVYRSMKYAAGSFSDLQELNQSVLAIVDVVFWICMFLIAQLVLQLDTTTFLAPILTIIFGASFAFANMLSNVITSVSFVLFVCPYDVGHRVILGYGSGAYAKGNILSVNLFYTTMITILNEKLVIPNHKLFDERIINLEESKYATFDLSINFCADGPNGTSRAKIDDYLNRVKDYMIVQHKGEWRDVDFYCIGYDAPNNIVSYSIWATHKGGWGEVSRTLNARTKLYEYLHVLKKEMHITHMKLVEPRSISYEPKQTRGVSAGVGFVNPPFSGIGDDIKSSIRNGNDESETPKKSTSHRQVLAQDIVEI